MEKEILCLILDQDDEYELFTSPAELIAWLKSFSVSPSRVLNRVIAHYRDNPRIPAAYDLKPFLNESGVNSEKMRGIVENWKKLDENIVKTVPNYTRHTEAELEEEATNLLKYSWK